MTEDTTGALAPPETSTESDNLSPDALVAELTRRQAQTNESEADTSDTTDTDESTTENEEESPANEQDEPEVTDEAPAETAEEEQPADDEEPSEDEDVLSQDSEKKRGKDKRIDRLTARAKTAEEAKAALEAEKAALQAKINELTQAPEAAVTASADDPLADVMTPEALEKRKEQARQVRRVIEDALDEEGDELEIAGKVYQRSELKKMNRDAQRDLEERIPARQKWIEQRNAVQASVTQTFPWFGDSSTKEYQAVQAELRRYPELNRIPAAPAILALAVKGNMALAAEKKAAEEAKKKPKAAPAKPPPVDTDTVAPPKRTAATNKGSRAADLRKKVTSTNMSSGDAYHLLLQSEIERKQS